MERLLDTIDGALVSYDQQNIHLVVYSSPNVRYELSPKVSECFHPR